MVKMHPSDPSPVTISTQVYRLLLAFYPAKFRREYGAHMVQVFRDCCLKTFHQSGSQGLLRLWAYTLFDWFKTIIEEQIQRGTEMTQSKFIRLSGWGMMLGSVALLLGIFTLQLGGDSQFYYLVFGTPSTSEQWAVYKWVSENIFASFYTLLLGLLLIIVGIGGVWSHYKMYGSQVGKGTLWVASIGGLIGFSGGLLIEFSVEYGWWLLTLGYALISASLATFGLLNSREKSIPLWNGFLLFGFIYPAWMLISVFMPETLTDQWASRLTMMSLVAMTFPLIGMIGLGYKLQNISKESSNSVSVAV